MSILLDALKKSEEERRMGETPSIHGPADHRPGGDGRRVPRWLIIVFLLLITLAVIALAWRFLPSDDAGEDVRGDAASTALSGAPATSARDSAESGVAAVKQEQPEETDGKVTHTLVESYSSSETRAQAEGQERAQEGGPPEGASADDPRKELNRSFKQFQAPAEEKDPVPAADEDVVEAAPETETPVPDRTRTRSEPGPISYWELPQSVRDDLPELRISVLVYAEEPNDRFLLINGERMREGDTLNGMVLDEIRRDGAVFRYRKYTFLIRG